MNSKCNSRHDALCRHDAGPYLEIQTTSSLQLNNSTAGTIWASERTSKPPHTLLDTHEHDNVLWCWSNSSNVAILPQNTYAYPVSRYHFERLSPLRHCKIRSNYNVNTDCVRYKRRWVDTSSSFSKQNTTIRLTVTGIWRWRADTHGKRWSSLFTT